MKQHAVEHHKNAHPLLAKLEAALVPTIPKQLNAASLERAVSSNLPHDLAHELNVLSEFLCV
jgi:hypothetical protein